MINLLTPRPERDLPPGQHERRRTELLAIIDSEVGARRRRLLTPLLAAAAVIAVVAGLTVGATAFRHKSTPDTAASGGKLDSVEVPYASYDGAARLLHDGARAVPLGTLIGEPIVGRVAAGWFTFSRDMPEGISRAGVLTTAGSFIQRGPANADQAVLSPDHTKAALVVRIAEGRFRIVVIDVSSGKQLYAQPLSAYSVLQGWNNFGIWYDAQSAGSPTVWDPGTPTREVTITGFDALWAYGTTDRMVVETRKGQTWCIQVVTMDSTDKLTPERELCGTGAMKYPVLSPDGKTLVVPELKKAISVADGTEVNLAGMPDQPNPIGSVFEDASHILSASVGIRAAATTPGTRPLISRYAVAPDGALRPIVEQVLVRCDVVTGNCEKLFENAAAKEAGKTITLGNP
jgi:hypothetical protein